MCWESFVPKWRGVVLVGRIMSCSGLVLVPVAGLWQRPGAAHGLRGQAVPRSLFWGCGVGRVLSRQPVLRRSWRRRGSLQASDRWGFCTTRSLLTPCRRRVGPPCRAIPPIGGGAAVVCSGVALKSQTTSVKNTENGLLVVKWSAFWVQRCLSWCVGRTQARYCEC